MVSPEVSQKRAVLNELNFGARVAEDEQEGLADYFVETDQWQKVVSGRVDVVFGPKGAGKSAIYTSLMNREGDMFDRGIILISAEQPRGATVFQNLVVDPPTSELQFVGIWKLHILTLLGSVITEYDLRGNDAKKVLDTLMTEGLLSKANTSLASRFQMVWDWTKAAASRVRTQGVVNLDPLTGGPAISLQISLQEPSTQERASGVHSLDDLLTLADAALAFNDLSVWILFDRLDVAFSESHVLEANGIRALFKTYLDMRALEQISLKIFLRTDIWNEVTKEGFREASHITRHLLIDWESASLLNLIVRRAVRIPELIAYYNANSVMVLQDAKAQRTFFDMLVPEKVDVGKNPQTFDWILGRVQDGTKRPAPREVIHLLNEARDAQLKMLERGEPDPLGTEMMSRVALRDSLLPVSQVRLFQTLYAEYPLEKSWIKVFEGEKTEHTASSLAIIWEVPLPEASTRAQRLVEIGFLELRGHRDAPTYWVPFLYRPALNMRQGAAG